MINVYLSRSYRETDVEFYEFLVKILDLPEIKDKYSLKVYDTISEEEARPVHEKVARDILSADVVVGIFSKRDKIEGSNSYNPPLWVVGEVAFALACQKKLLFFHEEGIEIGQLGFISSQNLTSIEYSKEKIGQAGLLSRIKNYVVSLLKEGHTEFVPTHVFRHFAKTVYVFPDGYGVVRTQVRLQPLKEIDSVNHHFFLDPEGLRRGDAFELPSIAAMTKNYERFLKNGEHSPSNEFFSFVSADSSLRVKPLKEDKQNERRFDIILPPNCLGKSFRYEWTWGSQYMHRKSGENYSTIGGGQAPISSCVFVLKVRKRSNGKDASPVLSLVNLLTKKPISDIRECIREASNMFNIYVFKTTQAETQANLVQYKLKWYS